MFVAGNWKMNTLLESSVSLASEMVKAVGNPGDVKVALCPPAVNIEAVAEILKNSAIKVGAQNMHHAESGAFTGEVSAEMIQAVGCTYVILGHSERRQFFGETDASVNQKTVKALTAGLIPIVCVGESLDQRESGQAETVVKKQVVEGLAGVSVNNADEIVVAYEPVWAIGTGKTASPQQAQDMHASIRGWIKELLGAEIGSQVDILYGGSVKPANADELFGQADINGGLIGGASLKATDFAGIVAAAKNHS